MTQISLRRPVVAVLAAGGLVGVGLASAHAAAPRAADVCLPKRSKVDGHPASTSCGRATGTFTTDGHSFGFRDGSCGYITHGTTLVVSFGTIVSGDATHNGGRSDLIITADRGTPTGLVSAFRGGRNLAGASVPTVSSAGPTGTFRTTGPARTGTPTFHGTWNCHGDVIR